MKEIWKPIPIEALKYTHQISNYGLVRLKDTKKILPRNILSGYMNFMYKYHNGDKLIQKCIKIHRMVAKAFIKNDDPENKIIVNHINGDRYDCRVYNLEWVTPRENVKHVIDNNNLISLTKRAVIQYDLQTGKTIKKYNSLLEANKETGINDNICNVCSGKRKSTDGFGWKNIDTSPNNVLDIDLSKYKQINGFPNYVINNKGDIYSLPYKKFLKYRTQQEGYKMIQLSNLRKQKDFLIHRLVGSYFLKKTNPKTNSIRHIDGNKGNNNVKNLEWCYVPRIEMLNSNFNTPFYNPETAISSDKRKRSESKPKNLLTANPRNLSKKQQEERKKLLKQKNSGSKISKSRKKINND